MGYLSSASKKVFTIMAAVIVNSKYGWMLMSKNILVSIFFFAHSGTSISSKLFFFFFSLDSLLDCLSAATIA